VLQCECCSCGRTFNEEEGKAYTEDNGDVYAMCNNCFFEIVAAVGRDQADLVLIPTATPIMQ